jgi:hypothetical protein
MSSEDVPIEIAKVIAASVLLMVGEFQSGTALPGRPLSQHLPVVNSLGQEVKRFELLQEVRVEHLHTRP